MNVALLLVLATMDGRPLEAARLAVRGNTFASQAESQWWAQESRRGEALRLAVKELYCNEAVAGWTNGYQPLNEVNVAGTLNAARLYHHGFVNMSGWSLKPLDPESSTFQVKK